MRQEERSLENFKREPDEVLETKDYVIDVEVVTYDNEPAPDNE